jgi:hypothetical protein
MTGASPLLFPGSRVLAGWWRQLAPVKPLAVWFGHLFLHRVEALVSVARTGRPDALGRLVLQSVAQAPASTSALDARLHLGPAVLRQLLAHLQHEGLARTDEPGRWTLTPLGNLALEKGSYSRPMQERRVFHFVADRRGQFGAEPRCVELHTSEVGPWSAAEGWAFDSVLLGGLVGRDPEWKCRHGFPLDVQEVLGLRHGAGETNDGSPSTNHTDLPRTAWRQVIVDVPEHLPAVLVLVSRGGAEGTPPAPQLRGFAVRQEGWVLHAERPAFTVATAWQETFPELATEPPLEVWQQAWKTWCQPRGVPASEITACVLERHDYRLRVQVPKRLLDRLRATRSDALKGEAWLLPETGDIRPAALIEVHEG